MKGKAIWDPVGKTKSRREVGGREACKGEKHPKRQTKSSWAVWAGRF